MFDFYVILFFSLHFFFLVYPNFFFFRYLAVTQPLNYSRRRRSKRLALYMIFIVWMLALTITCPPILGWYEPGRRGRGLKECRYNENKGYVVFSAMGKLLTDKKFSFNFFQIEFSWNEIH